ncbi:MAG: DHH family phosphoesterase, partial [Anaerohalosphaera sp.]|nr:DHH family phosphoesterase [Anaerohalosphaera sp.]
MATAQDFDQAIELINKSTNIIVTSHNRPDGDACGCVHAMCMALRSLGKTAVPLFLSPVPKWYAFLFESEPGILGETLTIDQLEGFDLVVVVDTNSYVQLPQLGQWLKDSHLPVLVIDHHITGDGLGAVEVIDTSAGAAGIIVYDLLIHAGWPIT